MNLRPELIAIVVALGIGLLIGVERERRKGDGPERSPAGIRTFTIASLTGAVSTMFGGKVLLAMVTAGIITLISIAYWRSRSDDPGLTSEIALVLTVLLGGLAAQYPALAAGVGVVLTALLAARSALHDFVRKALNEDEIHDGLVFAAATLVIYPLLPDRTIGPLSALNPRAIWLIVILAMAISAVGHISIRLFGAKSGLAISGFASGFVSSVATIGAMGARARAAPELLGPATAGAALSTVATIVQLLVVLAAISPVTLQRMLLPLLCAGAAALLYAGILMFNFSGQRTDVVELQAGRAFSLPSGVMLALTFSGVLLLSSTLRQAYGEIGLVVGAGMVGFADTHSAAMAVASQVASENINLDDAVFPILAALSTNTATKIVVSSVSGGPPFALRLVPGLLIVVGVAWASAVFTLVV